MKVVGGIINDAGDFEFILFEDGNFITEDTKQLISGDFEIENLRELQRESFENSLRAYGGIGVIFYQEHIWVLRITEAVKKDYTLKKVHKRISYTKN